jgi:protein tyrosine/serine phosphatase
MLFLFADDMILYLKIPKDSTRKLLDLILLVKYKNQHIKISIAFLYIRNEYTEKENRKTISFTITSKKYLGVNLTKEVKDSYNENYRTMKKEMEEDTGRQKGISS